MDNIDKENNCVPVFGSGHTGTPIHSSKLLGVNLPVSMNKDYPRTPLQDINNRNTEAGFGLGKAAKIVQYGQLTPLTVPATKNRERKGNLQKMGILDFDSSNSSAPDRLEARRTPYAQYRKMMGAFQYYRQDYEERLCSKDNYIKSLEEKLETQLLDSPSEMKSEKSKSVKKLYNESDTDLQLQDSNTDPQSLTSNIKYCKHNTESSPLIHKSAGGAVNADSLGIGTSPHRTPIPLKKWSSSFIKDGTRRRSSIVSYASPSNDTENDDGTRSIGCSPIKIPVEHLEAHSSSGEDMSPRDDQLLRKPVSKTETSNLLETSKTEKGCKLNNDTAEKTANENLPDTAKSVKLMEICLNTSSSELTESLSKLAKDNQCAAAVAGVVATNCVTTNTEIREFKDCEVNTSSLEGTNVTNNNDEVTEYVESGINTSVNDSDNVAMNTESFEIIDTSVNTSFIDANYICHKCSNINENSEQFDNIPNLDNIILNTNSVSCNTSLLEYRNEETNTEIPGFSDISINTSSIEFSSTAINTENGVFVDGSMNTSLSGTVVAEKENLSVGTEITPKKSVDVTVWTSPTCLYVARPSVVDGFAFEDEDLKFQLESASISNTLLREELQQTHVKQQEVFDELEKIKEINTDTESRIKQAEKSTKASFEDQIESLMLQQAEHLTEIATFKSSEEKHLKQITWLKEQNSTLQSDLKLAYKQKKDEIKALTDKYSKDDYKSLYRRSQAELTKTKSQLQEFADLVNILQDSQQTQVEAQKILEVGLTKVKEVAEKNKLERIAFEGQVKSWQEEKAKAEEQTRILQEQCSLIQKESENVNKLLDEEKAKILQLEEQLRLDSDKLTVAERTVEDISSVNKTMIQGLDEKDFEIKKLESEKEAFIAEIKELSVKIMSMTDLFEELEMDLKSFKAEVAALQEQKTELNGKLEMIQERYDSDTTILQRTIDARDEEVDRLNKTSESLQKVCSKQKYLIESTRQQLNDSQGKEKELYIVQEQLLALQQTSKENKEFMEQEHNVIEEETSVLKKKNQRLQVHLESVSTERDNFSMQFEEMSLKYKQLEAELDHVKTEAHMMLLQQVHEINSGTNSVSKLSERLHAMYRQLEIRSGKVLKDQFLETNEAKETVNNTQPESSSSNLTDGEKVRKSFLNSVLTAIVDDRDDSPKSDGTNSGHNSSDTNLEPPVHNVLGSSFSAFRKVQVEKKDSVQTEQVSLCEQGSAESISSNCMSDSFGIEYEDSNLNVAASNKIDREYDTRESVLNDNEDEMTLTTRVDTLYKLVGDIISLVKVLDNTFNENEECLKKKISSLEEQLELEQLDKCRSLKGQDDKAASLQLQLIDAKQIEKQLRSDLHTAKQQYVQSEQNLRCVRKMCEEKTLALEKVMDSQIDTQKLKQEVSKLQRALAQKTTECKISQESLENALLKLDEKYQGKSNDVKYANENYLLKLEVNKLKHQLFKKKEEMDEVISKANSRNKTYEQNYNKAMKEIVVMDNTIDNLRYLLRRHKDEVRTWPDAKEIWNEIVYDKRVDDTSMKWS